MSTAIKRYYALRAVLDDDDISDYRFKSRTFSSNQMYTIGLCSLNCVNFDLSTSVTTLMACNENLISTIIDFSPLDWDILTASGRALLDHCINEFR